MCTPNFLANIFLSREKQSSKLYETFSKHDNINAKYYIKTEAKLIYYSTENEYLQKITFHFACVNDNTF